MWLYFLATLLSADVILSTSTGGEMVGNEAFEMISSALKSLGFVQVQVVADSPLSKGLLLRHLNRKGIMAAFGEGFDTVTNEVSIPLVIYGETEENIEILKRVLDEKAKLPHRTVVVSEEETLPSWALKEYEDFGVTGGFLRLEVQNGGRLFRAQTLKNERKFVQNLWKLDQGTSKYVEVYDMQGATVNTVDMSWPPFIYVSGCDGEAKNCEGAGPSLETIMAIAEIHNFSLVVNTDPDGDWGSTPKTGDYGPNTTFGGIMVNKFLRRLFLSMLYIILL